MSQRTAFESAVRKLQRYPQRTSFTLSRDLLERLCVEMKRMNDAGLELVRKLNEKEAQP